MLRCLREYAAACSAATAAGLGAFQLAEHVFPAMSPTKLRWETWPATGGHMRGTFSLWVKEAAAAGLLVDRGYSFYSLKRGPSQPAGSGRDISYLQAPHWYLVI